VAPAAGQTSLSEQGAGLHGKAETQNTPQHEDLTGDRGGLRTRPLDARVTVTGRYTSESAFNATAGNHGDVTEAGQLDVGHADRYRPARPIPGGTVRATVSWRRARSRTCGGPGRAAAGARGLRRGQTWRLTQFWYEQSLGAARLKLGRSAPSEDFVAFSCNSQKLSLCGTPPGNIVGDYWYNWPISQWSATAQPIPSSASAR